MDREWQQISTAPYDVPVEIKAGRMVLPAVFRPGASIDEDERPCDQWQATSERHPRCWSDGACWAENANGLMSAQPRAWRPLQTHTKASR